MIPQNNISDSPFVTARKRSLRQGNVLYLSVNHSVHTGRLPFLAGGAIFSKVLFLAGGAILSCRGAILLAGTAILSGVGVPSLAGGAILSSPPSRTAADGTPRMAEDGTPMMAKDGTPFLSTSGQYASYYM